MTSSPECLPKFNKSLLSRIGYVDPFPQDEVCQICHNPWSLDRHHVIPKRWITISLFGYRLEHQINIATICFECNRGLVKKITNKIIPKNKLLELHRELLNIEQDKERKEARTNKFVDLVFELRREQGLPEIEFLFDKRDKYYIKCPVTIELLKEVI